MKTILAGFLVFVAVNCLALDIFTKDGKLYRNCEVKKVEADGVRISHRDGSGFLDFDELPSGLQKQYGWTPEKSEARKAAKAAQLERQRQADVDAWRAKQAAAAEKQRQFAEANAKQQRETSEAEARLLASRPPEPKPTPPPTWIEEQRATIPENIQFAIVIAAGVIGLAICLSFVNSLKRRREWKRMCADCDEYLALVKQGRIPTVPTNIMLKSDERAFYCAPSSLYETRAVRHSQSGFAGFRIAKGVWVGGSSGRSVSNQEWAKLDSGMLTITDERLVFDGGGAARTISVGKVVSVTEARDSVEVSVENRQKCMVFSAANPLILAAIIRISCKLHDSAT